MWKFLLNKKVRYFKYISAIVFSLLIHYSFYNSEIIKTIDYKFYDMSRILFDNSNKDDNSSYNTIIVNIDEKSLQKVGQWPWSRNIDAQLIYKIYTMNPATVAINIVFPELDRTSPATRERYYSNTESMSMPWDGLSTNNRDYDKLLIDAVHQSNATLSVYLHNKENMSSCEETLFVNLRFQYLNNKLEDKPSILCNHKMLQKSVKNFGFINLESDEDAFLRRVSFFMNHNGVVIPSFALATLLSLDKDIAIDENNRLQLLNHSIKMSDDMKVLLNFHRSLPKTVSAIDILQGKVDSNIFKGKIVLIGLSIIGSNNIYPISEDIKISNMEIQATFIENLLDEVLLVQPKIYQKINILLSFLFSCLLIYFTAKRQYKEVIGVIITLLVVLFLYLILFYIHGVYVSIGYFLLPFLVYLSLIIFIFIMINIREKKRFYYELRESHSATVESISLVVALRDGETGEHIQRTKNYVKALAEHLYRNNQYQNILNQNYILYLYEAAPLHDIGKIGIPDAILKKEGKYTAEEYKVMKEHPILAKAVIEKAMKFYDKNIFLEMAYNIAYYHHERWDGKGYPLGLKGDKIPLEAQLMSIGDVYDALVSKRSYKEGYDYDKVESIILDGRGTAFNPILVDAFMEIKEEFRTIHRIWKEEQK